MSLINGLAWSDPGRDRWASGESAGRLERALEHRVGRVSEERDLRMEVVAEWLPRVVYFLVVVQLLRGFL